MNCPHRQGSTEKPSPASGRGSKAAVRAFKVFTGIVTAIGRVRSRTPLGNGQDMRLVIATPWPDAA
ncbi:MAG TPA: hypothetical protein VE650_03340, partial [Acetobacteraceae bacterium]|nr:hypothetical protein [Acetobacteraceae bacterium]